jgi:hypothetical protein
VKILSLFFLLFFTLPALADFTCNDSFKRTYVKGNYNSTNPSQKVFKFKQMRDELMTELNEGMPNGDKASCLIDFYQKSMLDSADAWAKRQSEASCTEACQAEYDRSTAFLGNLDAEFRTKVKERIPEARRAAEAAAAAADKAAACKARADAARDIAGVKNNLCCGQPDDPEGGAVYAIYPEINYNTCLGKSNATSQKLISVNGIAECLANVVTEAFKAIYNNITGILSAPGALWKGVTELWAAKSQIWQIATNRDARNAFIAKVMAKVQEYAQTRADALLTCLNPYEQKQYLCRTAGQIVGTLATPASMLKLLKLGSMATKAAGELIGGALSKSAKGQKMLAQMSKAKAAGRTALSKAGDAKTAAIAATKKAAAAKLVSAKKALDKLTGFSKAKESFRTRLAAAREKYGGRRQTAANDNDAPVRGAGPDAANDNALPTTAKGSGLDDAIDDVGPTAVRKPVADPANDNIDPAAERLGLGSANDNVAAVRRSDGSPVNDNVAPRKTVADNDNVEVPTGVSGFVANDNLVPTRVPTATKTGNTGNTSARAGDRPLAGNDNALPVVKPVDPVPTPTPKVTPEPVPAPTPATPVAKVDPVRTVDTRNPLSENAAATKSVDQVNPAGGNSIPAPRGIDRPNPVTENFGPPNPTAVARTPDRPTSVSDSNSGRGRSTDRPNPVTENFDPPNPTPIARTPDRPSAGSDSPAPVRVTEPSKPVARVDEPEAPASAFADKPQTRTAAVVQSVKNTWGRITGKPTSTPPVQLTRVQGEQLITKSKFSGADQTSFLKKVKEHNIEPSQTVTVGKTKISLSEPFDIGQGRVASIAVVENAGVTSTQIYYRSNSQGVFRLLPGTTQKGWFSKGIGEGSLDAPSEVQRALAQQVSAGKIRKDVPSNLYEEAVPKYQTAIEAQFAAVDNANLNIKPKPILSESAGPKINGKYSKPQDLVVKVEKQNPDFSKGPVSTYDSSTGAAGDVKVSVFKSKDGSLEYTFFEDKSGRAWVASVNDVKAPVNAAGIRSGAVDAGDLTIPRYEYHQQIPGGYSGRGRYGNSGEYGDAWPYLKEVPVIKDYYRSRGVAVPE